jgi:surface antigen
VRSVRAAVHTALPVLALGALAVLGTVRAAPSARPVVDLASQGGGTLAAADAGRIVTDGHPLPLVLPPKQVVATLAPPASPAPASRATTHVATRSAARAATQSRSVPRAAPSAVPQAVEPTTTDAYPYRSDSTGGRDDWGFTKRQCVSYVAWRLADLGRPIDNASQGWGSALDWDDTARRLGYSVSTRPQVGAVAQWNAHESGAYWSGSSASSDGSYAAGTVGHVAWVMKVYSDGSVLVAQYNGTGDRSYSTMRVKAPRYLSL